MLGIKVKKLGKNHVLGKLSTVKNKIVGTPISVYVLSSTSISTHNDALNTTYIIIYKHNF